MVFSLLVVDLYRSLIQSFHNTHYYILRPQKKRGNRLLPVPLIEALALPKSC